MHLLPLPRINPLVSFVPPVSVLQDTVPVINQNAWRGSKGGFDLSRAVAPIEQEQDPSHACSIRPFHSFFPLVPEHNTSTERVILPYNASSICMRRRPGQPPQNFQTLRLMRLQDVATENQSTHCKNDRCCKNRLMHRQLPTHTSRQQRHIGITMPEQTVLPRAQ